MITKRKVFSVLFLAMLLLALCSCSHAPMLYTIERSGVSYEVNKESNTISDGTNLYSYTFSGNNEDYDVTITYPDGSTYWWEMSGHTGSGGWSDDYDPEQYADGDILTEVLLAEAPKAPKHSGGEFFAVALLFALGLFYIVAPKIAWYLGYGWRYKDAEPSDLAIGFSRFGGVVAIIIAAILLFE